MTDRRIFKVLRNTPILLGGQPVILPQGDAKVVATDTELAAAIAQAQANNPGLTLGWYEDEIPAGQIQGLAGIEEDEFVAGDASGGLKRLTPAQLANSAVNNGTFIPTFTFSIPGDASVTYQKQTGVWSRIGNRIFFECLLRWTVTHSTASGQGIIEGLPFTVPGSIYGTEGGNGVFFSVAGFNIDVPANTVDLFVRINPSESNMSFAVTREGTSIVTIGPSSFPSGSALRAHISGTFLIEP